MSMSTEPILVAEIVEEVVLLMRPLSDAVGVSTWWSMAGRMGTVCTG